MSDANVDSGVVTPPGKTNGLSPDKVRYAIAKRKYQLSRAARLSGEKFPPYEEWLKLQGKK